MSNRFRGRVTLALITVALVSAIVVTTAIAAGYGRGRFVGSAKPQFGEGAKTPIVLKVKGNRARVVEMTFTFGCASDGSSVRRTVATPFTRVKHGPVGGGLFFNGKVTPKEGGGAIDLTVFMGLRERSINGTADATMDIEDRPCLADLIFKANKR
jgi:hypothetical protein